MQHSWNNGISSHSILHDQCSNSIEVIDRLQISTAKVSAYQLIIWYFRDYRKLQTSCRLHFGSQFPATVLVLEFRFQSHSTAFSTTQVIINQYLFKCALVREGLWWVAQVFTLFVLLKNRFITGPITNQRNSIYMKKSANLWSLAFTLIMAIVRWGFYVIKENQIYHPPDLLSAIEL